MPPALHHFQEFKEALDRYHVSDRGLKAIEGLKLILMLGPSTGGRNTIIRHQVATGRYYHIISDTTRPPRVNDGIPEQNGVDYYFRTEEEMLADVRAGEFLEAEIIHGQQVSGISIRELEKAKAEGKIAINDIDIVGIHNVMKIKSNAFVILVVPPSFEEWQRRLSKRGVMRPDELKRRLQTAEKIFDDALKQSYYHFVISENVEQSGGIIDAIIEGKPNPHQGRAPGVIEQIQYALRNKLSEPF
jgi:guanylate kinase